MKTSIILALFSMLLIGCNKETVNFHVKIINPATGQGYANHKFYIKSSRTRGNGENVKTRYSGTTNENGEAIVTLKVTKDTWFLTCEAVPNTCYINNPKQHYSNRADLNPEFVFEIAPCAYSKLTINNVNCEGPNDLMVLYRSNQIGTSDGSFGWQHNGCAFWQTNGQSNIPMGNVYYRWEVTRSTGTTIYYDTVYYAPGVLTEYTINY